ncbi:MAG: Rpn family recombination-promoting nuclease/putative transposase [Bacteroidales bacterium]|nr:Rpn family recombination-promoting nuclease/putative transposase [Bacteroidales bacterium]
MARRKRKELKELTIVDDFMFGAVMSNPKLCKPLLEMILGEKINRIEYPELQKTIDMQYGSKGVRLDVYVEDEKKTVYNIEIQATATRHLPKRMRYYQGMIDMNIIDKGGEYGSLKKSFVIFICTHDPFDEGRYVYTFENRCIENPDLSFGDETTKIILNTKGSVGEISEDLKATLRYIDGEDPQSEYTVNLRNEVEDVRVSEKWRREYMTLMMRDKQNKKLGRYESAVSCVRELYGEIDDSRIMSMAKITQEEYDAILRCITEHTDWDDEDIADWLIEEFE